MSSSFALDEVAVTLNGFAAGPLGTLGVASISGLDDLPEVRTSDTVRVRRDGDLAGTDYLASRTVQLELRRTVPIDQVDDALAALRRALRLGDGEMVVSGLPGLPALWLQGRVRKAQIPTDQALSAGLVRARVEFYCPDPLRYAARLTVLTLDLREQLGASAVTYGQHRTYGEHVPYGTGSGGAPLVYMAPPLTPPLRPGGRRNLVGVLTANNAGLLATSPLVKVFGPSPAFALLNGATGRTFRYRAAVPSGEYLEIDMAARTVLENGQTSRRANKGGTWWDLPPGESSIAYLPDGPAVGAVVRVEYRDAY